MRRFALVLLCLVTACTGSGRDAEPSTSEPVVTTVPRGVLAGLTIELDLADRTMETGDDLGANLVVRNETYRTIVDPDGCTLGNTSKGLVPADQPDADLWMSTMTDCSMQPFPREPGYFSCSVTFLVAADRYGDPLPPGEYLAVIEADNGNIRAEAVVTVVADTDGEVVRDMRGDC